MKTIARINQILPVATGISANGPWMKQSIIFSYIENPEKRFMVNFMGQRFIDKIAFYRVGDYVEVGFELTVREYNDALFTDVKGFMIVKLNQNQATMAMEPSTAQQLPGQQKPAEPAQPVSQKNTKVLDTVHKEEHQTVDQENQKNLYGKFIDG